VGGGWGGGAPGDGLGVWVFGGGQGRVFVRRLVWWSRKTLSARDREFLEGIGAVYRRGLVLMAEGWGR
jgi:hypothetical protein